MIEHIFYSRYDIKSRDWEHKLEPLYTPLNTQLAGCEHATWLKCEYSVGTTKEAS